MALRFKDGVNLAGLQPQALYGLAVATRAYADAGLDCWVTSAMDSSPGRVANTLHRVGLAFDLRLPSRIDDGRSAMTDGVVFLKLRQELGTLAGWLRVCGYIGTFDAIKHDIGFGDHIHVEWDSSHE